MKAEEMWNEFCKSKNIDISTPYEAWSFGTSPDELAELVLKGIKTGTSSAYDIYEKDDNELLPKENSYCVIENSIGEAVCVIETTKVYIVPFSEVSEEHAYKEGEGNRSLEYWRMVHEDFFKAEFEEYGIEFNESRLIMCEEFKVVFK